MVISFLSAHYNNGLTFNGMNAFLWVRQVRLARFVLVCLGLVWFDLGWVGLGLFWFFVWLCLDQLISGRVSNGIFIL